MANILLIDNYDSFTYNLVQAFRVLGAEVDVRRNDVIAATDDFRYGSDSSGHLTGTGPASRCRRLDRSDQRLRRQSTGTRCLSRSPVHRRSVWRTGRFRANTDAWQELSGHT